VFEAEIISSGQPCVIAAYAEWSRPSVEFCNGLQRLCEKFPFFTFGQFDVTVNPLVCSRQEIRTVPTIQFIYKGKLTAELSGRFSESEAARFLEHSSTYVTEPRGHNDSLKGAWRRCEDASGAGDIAAAQNLLIKLESHTQANDEWEQWTKARVALERLALTVGPAYCRNPIDLVQLRQELDDLIDTFPEELRAPRHARMVGSAAVLLSDDPSMTLTGVLEEIGSLESAGGDVEYPLLPARKQTQQPENAEKDGTRQPQTELAFSVTQSLRRSITQTSPDATFAPPAEPLTSDEERLVRLHRIAASKCFREGRYDDAFDHAIQGYRLDTSKGRLVSHLNHERTALTSRAMLQNLATALGGSHPAMQEARAKLDALCHPDGPQVMRRIPPCTNAFGGIGRRERGNWRRKWTWHGPDWKPPWAPKVAWKPEDWAWP